MVFSEKALFLSSRCQKLFCLFKSPTSNAYSFCSCDVLQVLKIPRRKSDLIEINIDRLGWSCQQNRRLNFRAPLGNYYS